MIVVGIDGSEGSKEAFAWAFAEAQLRQTKLLAVYVWQLPTYPAVAGFHSALLRDRDTLQAEAEAFLASFVAENLPVSEEVDVAERAAQGSPAHVLVQAAEGADLLVVGSRGRGGFAALLLGSVGHQCAQHATCPVVIVRPASAG